MVLCVVAIVLFGIVLFSARKTRPHTSSPPVEEFAPPASMNATGGAGEFRVYNHLLKPIRVEGKAPLKTDFVNIGTVQPGDSISFNTIITERYFRKDGVVRFSIEEPDGSLSTYSAREYTNPPHSLPEDEHIGMITSRFSGASNDFNIGRPANAQQGMPYVYIHNLTAKPIHLQNLIVLPHSKTMYKGRDHFGVRLGTIFSTTNGDYPDFIYTRPATDIYYGVISGIPQPKFGGWQLADEYFSDRDIHPHFLLEEGWMGGPAPPGIDSNVIPKENSFGTAPDGKERDRWGRNRRTLTV